MNFPGTNIVFGAPHGHLRIELHLHIQDGLPIFFFLVVRFFADALTITSALPGVATPASILHRYEHPASVSRGAAESEKPQLVLSLIANARWAEFLLRKFAARFRRRGFP
jgi:hypothetical protein